MLILFLFAILVKPPEISTKFPKEVCPAIKYWPGFATAPLTVYIYLDTNSFIVPASINLLPFSKIISGVNLRFSFLKN